MALSSAIVWEVRTTGADTNGGGFKAGASGTDWSQQDSAQYAVTDGVTNGTTTITSTTANFGTDVVGNVIYVAGGTGSITAGWYEITARNSASSITVDRSTGLTAGTGVTLNIGGALASPGQAAGLVVDYNIVNVQTGTYAIGSGTANTAGNKVSLAGRTGVLFRGYQATHGDNGTAPTFTAGANSQTIFSADGNSHYSGFQNLTVTNPSGYTSVAGLSIGSVRSNISRCNAYNCNIGFGGNCTLCYAESCTSGFTSSTCTIACVAKSCTTGFGGNATYSGGSFCIAWGGNVGFTANPGQQMHFANSVAYGCSSHGFYENQNGVSLVNCLAVYCQGKGLAGSSDRRLVLLNNAYYDNTQGTDDTDGIVLSGDPFTDAANGDFSLNNTAGAGADCRAAGIGPVGQTSYIDIGAVQHQDSGGGGGYAPVGPSFIRGIS